MGARPAGPAAVSIASGGSVAARAAGTSTGCRGLGTSSRSFAGPRDPALGLVGEERAAGQAAGGQRQPRDHRQGQPADTLDYLGQSVPVRN